jgi:ubiquinone/menaquinone biosynthesis C-methylase UbiE
MAMQYDRRFTTLYKPIIPLFRDSVSPSHEVIELGCGSGLVSFSVLSLVKKFVGIDFDANMISVANRKLENLRNPSINAQFLLADASKRTIHELTTKYDRVLLVNILHIVDSPKNILNQAKSLLRAGGSILITNFCHGEKMAKKYALLSILLKISSKLGLMGTLWRFKFSEIEQLVLDLGLNILRKSHFTTKFPFIFMEIA